MKSLVRPGWKTSASSLVFAGLSLGASGIVAAPITVDSTDRMVEMMSPDKRGDDLKAGTDALSAGDAVRAQAAFMRALSRRPDDVFALLGMASSMQLKGERIEALNWTLRALEHRPTDPKVLEAYARLSFENKDLPAAIERVTSIAEAHPQTAEPWRALARMHALSGHPDAALAALKQALEVTPGDPALRIDFGRAQLLAGHADAAVQTLDAVRKELPASVQVLEPLARAELARGKRDIALAHLVTLESRQALSSRQWELKGDILASLGRDQESAQAYGNAALDARGAQILMLKQAQSLDKAHRGREALALYDQVLALDPDSLVALNNAAYLAASEGQALDTAEDRALRAIRIGGERAPLYDTLAAVQIARGKTDQARASLERALKLDGAHASARARLNSLRSQPEPVSPVAVAQVTPPAPPVAERPTQPAAVQPVATVAPVVAAVETVAPAKTKQTAPIESGPVADPVADQAALTEALEGWRLAWEREQYGAYVAAYVPDASPIKGMGRKRWEDDRKRKLSKPGKLEIAVEAVEWTQVDENTWTSRFVQHYASSNYQDKSLKTLRWERRGDRWLIGDESAKTL